MAASTLPFVQWFTRDWFLSKARHRLQPDQRMAYCEILWLMYESCDAAIEWDPPYLSGLTGVGAERLEAVRRELIAPRELNMHRLNLAMPDIESASTEDRKLERVTHRRLQRWLEARKRKSEEQSRKAKLRWQEADSMQLHGFGNAETCLAEQKELAEQSRKSSSAIADGIGSSNAPRRGASHDQIPAASDRKPKSSDQGPAWNAWGETAPPEVRGVSRDADAPWQTRYCARRLREARDERERYVAAVGRNPEDPPPGWVNRTGKWQFVGRPAVAPRGES